eukprot:c25192_g1_i2 orf=162-2747(+)
MGHQQFLLHQHRRSNISNTTSKPHIISTHDGLLDSVALQNNGTAAMIGGSIRGSPNTWHGHQWSLAPLPSWKLYENPFFTEGQLVPKYVPHYVNAPFRFKPGSAEAQCAPRDPVLSSHIHEPSALTPNFCINKPHETGAAPSQPSAFPPSPHFLSVRDKFMAGPIVSARKLAATLWEQYQVNKLDQEPCDQFSSCAEAQQPHLQAHASAPACPSIPSNCQIPEALTADTRGVCGTGEASQNNMTTSQVAMLENVLHRMRLVEESQGRSMAMLNTLRLEMEGVTCRIHELEFSHKSALREINSLLQRFGEQMAISRRNEQEKARLAYLHLREEMEEERNACRLLKMQNKKLTKDLTHATIAAADACEELERERKARELLEEVCNELAREIGEDKAEVEQLKQEQEESRKRLEKELKMMRMAALWREERVRSKLSEVQLELDNGKQGMPLHELRNKLEAFVSTFGGTCEGSQEEIEKQAKQAKLLTQALELLELEESRWSRDNAEYVGPAVRVASGPACPNSCLIEETVSSNNENQLYGDEGNLSDRDTGTMNGIEHRMSVNETRRPHSGRRRWRANGQQRHNVGNRPHMRIYDQKNSEILETHCENLAWSSSEDVPDKLQLITLPLWGKGGHVVEGEDNANSEVANKNGMRHASSGYGRHTILPEMRPSVFATSNVHIKQKECCHLEQSLCNPVVKGSHRTHCLSARFEGGAGGEVDGKLGTEMGTSIRYSFSEDDAPSYIGSRGERRRKQGPLDGLNMSVTGQNEQASHNAVRDDHHHRHLDVHKSTGTVEAGAEDSELDDFYFEPVRAPPNASTNNINCKANEDEHAGNDTTRVERGVSNCSDEARCGIMAKYSQARKES